MSNENQMQEYESKQLIDKLSKMPPMLIATAYLYAINYTQYGEDVTEKWITATEQSCALAKAFNKGYSDALESDSGVLDQAIKALKQTNALDKIRAEIKALSPEPTAYDVVDGNPIKDAVWETIADVLKIIDKYTSR